MSGQGDRVQGGFPAPKNLAERIRQNERGSNLESYTEWQMVGVVDDPDWEAEFDNGWGNIGSPFPPFSYRLSEDGTVFIRGGITGGTPGSVITVLPAGYRPEYSERFVIPSGSTLYGIIQIDPSGTVTFLA